MYRKEHVIDVLNMYSTKYLQCQRERERERERRRDEHRATENVCACVRVYSYTTSLLAVDYQIQVQF